MRAALLVVFAIACAACSAPRAPEPPGDAIAGAAMFQGKARNDVACASCHGQDAKGGAIGPNLRAIVGQRTDAGLRETILDGEETMPPYRDKLSDQEVRNVVAFLRAK